MKRITVLLADDNAMVRKEYKKLLKLDADLEVVGEAKNGQQAVALVKKLRPAVVLMDVAMPLMNGIEALRQIIEAVPATKVLMLSSHNDDVYIAEAMNSGAMGYLIKYTAASCVCQAIRETNRGRTFFSPLVPKHFHQPKLKKSRCELDSKGDDLWRGLVRVTPEKFSGCAKRPPKGVSPKFFCTRRGGVGCVLVCGSIFVRHHQGDGGLRVVNIQCAASGDEFDKPRCAVVIADIKRNGDAVAT